MVGLLDRRSDEVLKITKKLKDGTEIIGVFAIKKSVFLFSINLSSVYFELYFIFLVQIILSNIEMNFRHSIDSSQMGLIKEGRYTVTAVCSVDKQQAVA